MNVPAERLRHGLAPGAESRSWPAVRFNGFRRHLQRLVALGPALVAMVLCSQALAAPPAFETVSTAVTGDSNQTTLTISTPAGTNAGDLLLAAISTDDNQAFSTPSGWTLLHQAFEGGAGPTLAVFYRIATATEPASHTFTWDGAEEAAGAILRYSGVDPADPVDVSAIGVGESEMPTAPSVTTAVDDTRVVRVFGADDDESPVTPPAGHTERVALESSDTGGSTTLGVADTVQATAGATGTGSFTIDDSEPWVAVTVALKPPGLEVDLQVTKSVDNPYPNEGDTVVYTAVATTNGPGDATGVIVKDGLPGGVTFISASASTGSYDSGAGVWTIGSLANGASATLAITATVDSGQPDSTLISNTASIGGDQFDPVSDNNSGSADITTCPASHIHNLAFVSGDQADAEPGNNANHICTGVVGLDFGDAPASYGDASHVVAQVLFLGVLPPDPDPGTQGGDGLGDDNDGNDDEDGVAFSITTGNIAASVAVTNTTEEAVTLCAWLDMDLGGTFDPGERQCRTATDPSGTFDWPVSATVTQDYYARYRVCSVAAECDTPTDIASDGEVEDYVVTYVPPTHATVGEIGLEAAPVDAVLSELTGGGDAGGLLAAWTPELAASLHGADAAAPQQALRDYLDPDGDGQVALVRWDTVEERGTVGFYVERQAPGEGGWQRLNGGLLRGLIDAPLGGEYWLADPHARVGETYRYRLIEQEAWGTQRHHGPWTLTLGEAVAPRAAAARRYTSVAAVDDGGADDQWSTWRGLGAGYTARRREPAVPELEEVVARLAARRADDRGRKDLLKSEAESDANALWLKTADEGLYSLPVSELVALTGEDERRLRRWLEQGRELTLSNDDRILPWHYDAAADALVFVAEAYESFHTVENAYRLVQDGRQARTMAAATGTGPAAGVPAGSFRETLRFEEEPPLLYSLWSVRDDPEADYWFWDYLYGGYRDRLEIPLALPGAAAAGEGELRIGLRGWTDMSEGNDHRVRAELNGVALGTAVEWDGFATAELVVSFDQGLLQAVNTLTLVTEYTAGEHPGQWLDQIEVDYWREPMAEDDRLWLHALEAGEHTVGGFTSAAIRVIEAPAGNPVWREDITVSQAGDGSYTVSFVVVDTADYLVVDTSGVETPVVEVDIPSSLAGSDNQADYLIIAPRALAQTAEALKAYRGRTFGRVAIAWLEDIYDEFSAGREEPEALSAFLATARAHWRGVPGWVVLLGKGTLDHRNRMGFGDSLLPVRLTVTPWALAPSDDRYMDTDIDGLMDFSYGRIPVASDAEGLAYIAKLEAYEASAPAPMAAVVVADNPDDGGDFHANAEVLGATLSGYGYAVTPLYHPEDPVRASLIDAATWEAAYVSYDGHGSATQIGNGSENFLTTTDVWGLTNVALPVFTALTCAAGDDSQPGVQSLAGALVLNAGGGAIAALAPTGLSLDADAQVLGGAFVDALIGGQAPIGAAARQAQAQASGQVKDFMLSIYQVVGEPVVRLR